MGEPTPLTYRLAREIGQCAADAFKYPPEAELVRVCLIVPGDIADDDCHCGQLALTVPRVYGSRIPPAPAADDAESGPCGMPHLVVELLLRIMRCVPGPDQAGNPPSCQQLDEAALQQHRDMHTVRRAVGCCLHDMHEANRVVGYQLGESTSVGPAGGCVGSQLQARFWIPGCTCPEAGV